MCSSSADSSIERIVTIARSITYRDWLDGIWRQSLDGGAPEKLPGLPTEKIYGYNWQPDGKYLIFSRGEEIRDVVLFTQVK